MRRTGAAVVVILLLAVAGFAQTFRGAINGTVTDPSDAVVASATVKATNVATAITITATTTSDGAFSFQDLPLGTYKISVTAAGFKSVTVDNDFWHNIPAVNQGGVSGIAGTIMPLDAIDEFAAQTQSSAEGGRNAGGIVNVVLRSGTNQLHGSVYYFNRNEAYGAASPFTPTGAHKPELRNYNLGFSIGGPIIKDKTFYFLTFEKQRYAISVSGLATEPTGAYQNAALALLSADGVPESPISANLISTLWPSSINAGALATNNFFGT